MRVELLPSMVTTDLEMGRMSCISNELHLQLDTRLERREFGALATGEGWQSRVATVSTLPQTKRWHHMALVGTPWAHASDVCIGRSFPGAGEFDASRTGQTSNVGYRYYRGPVVRELTPASHAALQANHLGTHPLSPAAPRVRALAKTTSACSPEPVSPS